MVRETLDSKKFGSAGRVHRDLWNSFAAIILSQVLFFVLFSIEFWQIAQLGAFAHIGLIALRLLLFGCLVVGLVLLFLGNPSGWKFSVLSQLSLIVGSVAQISVLQFRDNFPTVLTLLGVFFQIASLRMFFLRPIVVRYGEQSIKPWFRERRIAMRTPCQLQISGRIDSMQIDCDLVNLSLSGCLFSTAESLADGQWLFLSLKNSPDIILKVCIKDANHRRSSVHLKDQLKSPLLKQNIYSGCFEEKLSDEDFNRILRDRIQSDLPQQSAS